MSDIDAKIIDGCNQAMLDQWDRMEPFVDLCVQQREFVDRELFPTKVWERNAYMVDRLDTVGAKSNFVLIWPSKLGGYVLLLLSRCGQGFRPRESETLRRTFHGLAVADRCLDFVKDLPEPLRGLPLVRSKSQRS